MVVLTCLLRISAGFATLAGVCWCTAATRHGTSPCAGAQASQVPPGGLGESSA
jgi:hypothetical protein